VFVADYVLSQYGSGAVMAVPAHDARDYAFAQAHGMEVRQVVQAPEEGGEEAAGELYEGYGVLVNSGDYDGLSSQEAIAKILEQGGAEGVSAGVAKG
jgi:leucyl-tRNA synthetase